MTTNTYWIHGTFYPIWDRKNYFSKIRIVIPSDKTIYLKLHYMPI